jgi:large subunit ribosomal protein L9
MQVILLERVERLGKIGDEVSVKNGFARNFLIPQGKALLANDKNRNEAARAAAETESEKLEGMIFTMIRQAGDTGQLFGSVTARDITESAAAAGFKFPIVAVRLDKPIKTIGLTDVTVRLHADVTVTVQANVARSTEEADRQAKGEDIVSALQEANAAFASEQASELKEAASELSDMIGGMDED